MNKNRKETLINIQTVVGIMLEKLKKESEIYLENHYVYVDILKKYYIIEEEQVQKLYNSSDINTHEEEFKQEVYYKEFKYLFNRYILENKNNKIPLLLNKERIKKALYKEFPTVKSLENRTKFLGYSNELLEKENNRNRNQWQKEFEKELDLVTKYEKSKSSLGYFEWKSLKNK